MRTSICAPSYVLGEATYDYTKLEGLGDRCKEFAMPALPQLWGWGRYHVSEMPLHDLAGLAIGKTLASLPPGLAIDHMLFCSTEISGPFMESNDSLQRVLQTYGLAPRMVAGVSLSGCNSLINALVLARALLACGEARNVLLVAADKARSEQMRFQRHCILSDAACALVLSSQLDSGIELLDATGLFCPAGEPSQSNPLRGNFAVVRTALEQFLIRNETPLAALTRVLCPNFYLPLQAMALKSAGLGDVERFVGNVVGDGHCFSSDPIMNLLSCIERGLARSGQRLLIFSNADMHYGFGLIRISEAA